MSACRLRILLASVLLLSLTSISCCMPWYVPHVYQRDMNSPKITVRFGSRALINLYF